MERVIKFYEWLQRTNSIYLADNERINNAFNIVLEKENINQ